MTTEQIARICHETNRAYCQTIDDHTQFPWDSAADWQRESAVKGVEGVLNGTITRPEQAHESWLAEKKATGWKYGPVKDADKKEHPCLVPYAELPATQRVKDALFFAVVTACAGA